MATVLYPLDFPYDKQSRVPNSIFMIIRKPSCQAMYLESLLEQIPKIERPGTYSVPHTLSIIKSIGRFDQILRKCTDVWHDRKTHDQISDDVKRDLIEGAQGIIDSFKGLRLELSESVSSPPKPPQWLRNAELLFTSRFGGKLNQSNFRYRKHHFQITMVETQDLLRRKPDHLLKSFDETASQKTYDPTYVDKRFSCYLPKIRCIDCDSLMDFGPGVSFERVESHLESSEHQTRLKYPDRI